MQLGDDLQLASATPEGHGQTRRARDGVRRRLRRQVQLDGHAGLEGDVEGVAAPGPVEALGEAEAVGALEERQGVADLGAGLAPSGRLLGDEDVVGEATYGLEVGSEEGRVGDELLDRHAGRAGAFEVSSEVHGRPFVAFGDRLDPPSD